MRVAEVFKRLLGLDAVKITGDELDDRDGVELISISPARRRNRRMFCSRCGHRCTSVYDCEIRSWRHLDTFRV
jgi:hypothetical protein